VPQWLAPMFPPTERHNESLVVISVAAGLAGIFLAWLFYVARPGLADALAGTSAGCIARPEQVLRG